MKWYTNLKISAKLLLAFMVIALLALGVGLFGVLSLANDNESNKTLFTNYGNSQGNLGYIYGIYQEQRSLYRDIVIDESMASALEAQDIATESDDELMHHLAAYKVTCTTDKEMAQYTGLETKINAFREIRDEIIALGAAGDFDGAFELLKADSSATIISEATEAIDDAVASRIVTAGTMLTEAETSAHGTIIVMIAIVAAAVALAILLGIYVSRIISKPIGALSKLANQVAAGDFDSSDASNNNYSSQKDETGQLSQAFSGVINIVRKLSEDLHVLLGNIAEGRFGARADETAYKGEYQKIVDGINETINVFVNNFDSIPSPVMAIDKDFNILHMNAAGASVAGQTKEALVGCKCYDIFRTSDCQTEKCACMRAMQQRDPIENETDAHPNGLNLQIAYSGTPIIKNDQVVGAFEVVTDLTAIKKAKAKAEEQTEAITKLLMEVNTSAEQVAAGTSQVSDGSQEISQGAVEQASAIEQLTASVTQIAEQTRQNAERANQANTMSADVGTIAFNGNEQMKSMLQAMVEINESSENISKIIKVIDDIAFQTNILALNAAVEAARAGIHGKGFAVVAEEVRNLAAKSASAANETTVLIESSIKKAEDGTMIADSTAEALAHIVKGINQVGGVVKEIASSSNEQASGISEINNGIDQLSQVVQTNSATAEEAAAAAEELSSQAEILKQMVAQFGDVKQ